MISIKKQRTGMVRCFFLSCLFAALLPSSVLEGSVSLVLLGDVMLGRGVAQAHAAGDWDSVLLSLKPVIQAADIAAANLESPFGCDSSAPGNSRALIAPPEAVEAIAAAGIDLLTMVNNHAQDAGDRGVECTRDILASRGIRILDSESPRWETTIRGIRILFLAFNFIGPVDPAAWEDLQRSVREAAGAGTFVIVSLHWGMEYQAGHDALQEKTARRLAEARAAVLWGHHPHVVQEAEWMNGTLVLYSLGNAVFDQRALKPARRGELAWAVLDRRGVRYYAALPFGIDPVLGKTAAPDPFSLQVHFRPLRTAE
jgi:poly-gamma-glutamate capsule biosynthesis protein CapA/YwtB (metallophosphatase superfamily)